MNDYFWVWFPLWFTLFVVILTGPAEPAEREFSLYCTDLEAAAYYAEALSREDADELNTILEARACGFFTFSARGEVKETHVLGDTGFVAEFIRFDNGLKTITVSPETY
ncbi:hypothetical protein MAL1_00117 [Bacteriophage DSS3_MAL1]|nr:hypothetical protein MAL1_00117 [Bacteriophage DSS3_MAL1]